MKKQIIIGIDISSVSLDICIRQENSQKSVVIGNNVKEITKFFRAYSSEQLIVCMENTGRYNYFLYEVLSSTNHRVFVVSPLHLKKSMGLVRGKSDKVDAVRIAMFIERNLNEVKPWKCPSVAIQKIKVLLAERSLRAKNRRQLMRQQHEYQIIKKLGLDKSLIKMNEQLIAQIDKQIKNIEEQIEDIIVKDDELRQQSELMRTIPGVGKVLSWTMLAKTEGFTLITDPRKMACYSGVVPFSHQSGTSIKGKQRVSPYADKTLKSILHLAAMSAIRLKNDLQIYYKRKVAEGKNKMSVLNAVRNKIVHRIFAVIREKKPYENLNSDLVLS